MTAREMLEALARADSGDVADVLSGAKSLEDLVRDSRVRKCCRRAYGLVDPR